MLSKAGEKVKHLFQEKCGGFRFFFLIKVKIGPLGTERASEQKEVQL